MIWNLCNFHHKFHFVIHMWDILSIYKDIHTHVHQVITNLTVFVVPFFSLVRTICKILQQFHLNYTLHSSEAYLNRNDPGYNLIGFSYDGTHTHIKVIFNYETWRLCYRLCRPKNWKKVFCLWHTNNAMCVFLAMKIIV